MMNPDFSRPFILQSNTSNVEVGAILSQTDTKGYDHPVAHFSRKLLPREQKYGTTEKEYLVIKLGTEAFQVYLLGKEFTIQMDHRALKWLIRFKDNNNRIRQWKCHPFDPIGKELTMPMLMLSPDKLNLMDNLSPEKGAGCGRRAVYR